MNFQLRLLGWLFLYSSLDQIVIIKHMARILRWGTFTKSKKIKCNNRYNDTARVYATMSQVWSKTARIINEILIPFNKIRCALLYILFQRYNSKYGEIKAQFMQICRLSSARK